MTTRFIVTRVNTKKKISEFIILDASKNSILRQAEHLPSSFDLVRMEIETLRLAMDRFLAITPDPTLVVIRATNPVVNDIFHNSIGRNLIMELPESGSTLIENFDIWKKIVILHDFLRIRGHKFKHQIDIAPPLDTASEFDMRNIVPFRSSGLKIFEKYDAKLEEEVSNLLQQAGTSPNQASPLEIAKTLMKNKQSVIHNYQNDILGK